MHYLTDKLNCRHHQGFDRIGNASPPTHLKTDVGFRKSQTAAHILISARLWLAATLIVLASLVCVQASDAESPAFVLTSNTNHLIIDNVEYLAEPQPLDYRQASGEKYASRWQKLAGKGFNFGNFHAPVWFRFDLINNSDSNRSLLLEARHNLLSHIEIVFYNNASGSWSFNQKSGHLLRSEELPIKNYQFLFPFSLSAGERNTVYLRVDSWQLPYVMFDVWQPEVFREHNQQRTLLMGLFFGILFVMILYNMSLYIFTRDSNYLFYTIYVTTIVLYELAYTGIGGRYLWHHSFWLKENAVVLFASLSYLTATLFIRQFLALKKYGGWLLQLNNVFLVYFIIAVIQTPILYNTVLYTTYQLFCVLGPIAGTVTCVYLWIKGNVQAKYYTIAYAFLNLGTVILMLGITGVIESGLLTEYSQMIGFVMEVVLLSVALADRINRDRAAREEAQRVLLEVQRRAKEDLELRVLERTNELESTMQNLELVNQELQNAFSEVKQLSGLLPICSSCKKIRNDGGYWEQIEGYIRDHSQAEFSHGICPECIKKLFPEEYAGISPNKDKDK